jgi:hypothetical protein
MWWNIDCLQRFDAEYWDAPIFHPARGTFAYSEPQPLTGLVAWCLFPFLHSLPACYNLILIAWLTLNGWAAMRLARRCGVCSLACWSAAGMVSLLPFLHWQAGVLQATAFWPVLWSIAAWDDFGRSPSPGRGFLAGLAPSVTYLTCHYYALMLGTLLLAVGWCLVRPRIERKWLMGAACGLIVAGFLCGPLAIIELSMLRRAELTQPRQLVQALSLPWWGYLHTIWPQWLTPPVWSHAAAETGWGMSPGSAKWLTAFCGVGFGLAWRRRRRWTCFWLAWLACAAVLSLGTGWRLGSLTPFEVLLDHAPGYQYFRSPFRFAVFVQTGVVFLATTAIDVVARRAGKWRMRLEQSFGGRSEECDALPSPALPGLKARSRWVPVGLALVLTMCLLAEAWPPAPRRVPIPGGGAVPRWVSWLRDHISDRAVIAMIPFAQGASVADFHETAEWMWWQTAHRRRMVNGYSGLFPAWYAGLMVEMLDFPAANSIDRLRQSGAEYCLVTGEWRIRVIDSPARRAGRLLVVYSDEEGNVDIYRFAEFGSGKGG